MINVLMKLRSNFSGSKEVGGTGSPCRTQENSTEGDISAGSYMIRNSIPGKKGKEGGDYR